MNGPTSTIYYCPSSKKGYVVKNGVLRPMPGFFSGEDGMRIQSQRGHVRS